MKSPKTLFINAMFFVLIFNEVSAAQPLNFEQWAKNRSSSAATLKEEFGALEFALCKSFLGAKTQRQFQLKVLKPIEDSGSDVDLAWIAPVCSVGSLPQSVTVPVIHVVAQYPMGRLAELQLLRNHYLQTRNRPDVWLEIVNSRDSRGYSPLDTIEHMKQNDRSADEPGGGYDQLAEFICANGGRYSYYSKSCNKDDYPRILADLEAKGRRGDSDSLWTLGEMYQYGFGVDKSITKAFDYFARSAEKSGAERQKVLARMYEYGIKNVGEDPSKAVLWYARAGEFQRIGSMYREGRGSLRKDTREALKWFLKAHEQGDFWGTRGIADIYSEEKDERNAFKWAKISAEMNTASWEDRSIYQLRLSQFYFRGMGTSRDAVAAVYWQREVALNNPARRYWFEHVDQYPDLMSKIEELASSGNSNAQYLTGLYYDRDYPVSDYPQAARWYLLAARQGDAESQYLLGYKYGAGKGVPKDLALSKEWYAKAAAQGHRFAKMEK